MVQENKHGPDDRGPARRVYALPIGARKKRATDRRRACSCREKYHTGRRACFYGPGPARRAAGYPPARVCLPGRVSCLVACPAQDTGGPIGYAGPGPGPATWRRVCLSWTGPGLLVTDRRVFQSWTIAPGLLQHTGTACAARMFITAAGPRHGGRRPGRDYSRTGKPR